MILIGEKLIKRIFIKITTNLIIRMKNYKKLTLKMNILTAII